MKSMKTTTRLTAALATTFTATLLLTGCTASLREASTDGPLITQDEACQELVGGEDSLGYRTARWTQSIHESAKIDEAQYGQAETIAAEATRLAEATPGVLGEQIRAIAVEPLILADAVRAGAARHPVDLRNTQMAVVEVGSTCLEGEANTEFYEFFHELLTGEVPTRY